MKKAMWAGCAMAMLAVTACGGKDSDDEPSGKSAKSGAEAVAALGPNASAEQVARAARGAVLCPPAATTPKAAGAPVDDVVGVRPGMSWDEAATGVMCDNPLLVVTENTMRGYNINTYGQKVRQGFDAVFAEPKVEKSGQQIAREMQDEAMARGMNAYVAPLKPGQVRYFVSTMGMPGEEKVISVAREEYYPADKLPTVASIKDALIAKYGPPSQAEDNGQHSYVWWEYDPAGAQIVAGNPLHMRCRINVSPDSPINLTEECGAQIGALIEGAPANAGLAKSLAVTTQSGAAGLKLVMSTEDALKAADDARKAKELNSASGAAPKL